MVAVVRPSGECLFANAKLEDTMGVSRKTLLRGNLLEWLVEPGPSPEQLQLLLTLAAAMGIGIATTLIISEPKTNTGGNDTLKGADGNDTP